MPIGIFDGRADIGTVLHPGGVDYDADAQAYTVSGSGENMWRAEDAFHYVWKEVRGDVALTAGITFPQPGKDPHRKACLVIRQSLDAGAAYADAALHGDGLTSLQFRHAAGAITQEVQANVSAPARLRLEKRGAYVQLFFSADDGAMRFSGAATRLALEEPFYIGLGVCSHDKDAVETACFSDVALDATLTAPDGPPTLYSVLETQTIASTDRRVCLVTPRHIEAPNWLAGGGALLVNSGGLMYRVPAAGGALEPINTEFAVRCNNDHGVSPDGARLVISDQSQEGGQSLIYTLPVGGGTPERITPSGPSYWHGWSPDGATLTFCGQRDGTFGIFTIPATGGQEIRLTTAPGLDDGPEYSPDGRHIYFNSDRTGRMQIWRMNADGGAQEQITSDGYNDWFPHPSPDGRHLVFLSYEGDVSGHPPDKDVTLRLLPLGTGDLGAQNIQVLARIFGGQGTINVPCWSPDSRTIAFVTYQYVAADRAMDTG